MTIIATMIMIFIKIILAATLFVTCVILDMMTLGKLHMTASLIRSSVFRLARRAL